MASEPALHSLPSEAEDAGQEASAPWQWPEKAPAGPLLLFLLTATLYAIGSQLALLLIRESGLESVFFIPAGITVAFLIRLRPRLWWVVLLAAGTSEATMDIVAGYSNFAVVGYVAGNVLEPLIGALIVRRTCGRLDLARIRHVSWFLVGPVFLATAAGAAVGGGPSHVVGDSSFPTQFPQWWLGDAVGVLLVGGGILVWGSSRDRRTLASLWGAVLLIGSLIVSVAVSRSGLPIWFLVLTGVIVAGSVFGSRAVVVTAMTIAAANAFDLAFGEGVLVPGVTESTALIITKLRLLVFTVAGLLVAAEAHEGQVAVRNAAIARALVEQAETEARLERETAIRLQTALLPTDSVMHPDISVAARYEAGTEALLIGGDWYDIIELPGGRIGLSLGDVVGHGLEASVAMGRMRTAVSVLALDSTGPGELIGKLAQYAAGRGGTDFATAAYAVLDPATGRLEYASAGHPPFLVVAPDGSSSWLIDGRSPPFHDGRALERQEASTRLELGSLLIGYSDGLIERRDEDVVEGLARLQAEAVALSDRTPGEVCDRLIERMGVAESRNDDVVVVAIRYQPTARPGERRATPGRTGMTVEPHRS